MLPLSSEMRRGKIWTLTDAGRDAARQLLLDSSPDDPLLQILRMLEKRPLSASYLAKSMPLADKAIRALERKRFIVAEEVQVERDPLRAPSDRLRVELAAAFEGPEPKFNKPERELRAFLELHPGSHNLKELEDMVKHASAAARSLARKGMVSLKPETVAMNAGLRARHDLNPAQQAAFQQMHEAIQAKRFQTFLLHGVTGSGKTEVYLTAIETALAEGRSALLMVPEIALTPQMAGQFFSRFGARVAILHSAFTDVERTEQWRRIRSGAASVVVGTRSGVFAPVANLGLIIVDEEHDGSYKQEESPRYNGRDVALVRARSCGALVVLGSATPSLESYHNAQAGRYELLTLRRRVLDRPMAAVTIVDMRAEFADEGPDVVLSRRLRDAMTDRLDKGEQAIVLLNRRGFATVVFCRECGETMECPNCSVTLTVHKAAARARCHYCNHSAPLPKVCAKCAGPYLEQLGFGTERVEAEVRALFPSARVGRVDRDTIRRRGAIGALLARFAAKELDVLVGTQMIAKGHDFPGVTLVGVISADVGLGLADFRAAQRTFQLLTQVAGRSGRGVLAGEAVVQTLYPNHYSIQHACRQDYQAFYEDELTFRRAMRYPPSVALINVVVKARTRQGAMADAGVIA